MIDNGLHLEFYGLPGCGKSTVCAMVARRLRSGGYRVTEASAGTGNELNPFARKLIKISRALLYYGTHAFIYKRVRETAAANGYTGSKERLVQTVNVAQKLCYYDRQNKGQILVWDEGLTQAAVSLSVNGDLSGCENERRLKDLLAAKPKQIHVYIKAAPAAAMERMDKRKTNNSRVEKEASVEGKLRLLNRYEAACDSIEQQIVVDANERTAQAVAEDVLTALKKYGIDTKN